MKSRCAFWRSVSAALLAGGLSALAAEPADLAARVSADMRGRSNLDARASATWYAVPALSPVKRLPSVFPEDGELAGTVRMTAARDEFEPASFLIFPFQSATRAELKVSALTAPEGTIPAAQVDVKVVKCWYQGGTAWYSYFADVTGRALTPELLLNDESLIRVDGKTKDNYLRLDEPGGSNEVWISSPAPVSVPFNPELTPVADARALQPFRLEAGAFKQIWVTVKVPADAAPGLYRGTLSLSTGAGSPLAIPLSVRVLPFELPAPATYYDPSREFYTLLYNNPQYMDILALNSNDWAHADRKMLALYRNMGDHNIRNPRLADFQFKSRDGFIRQLELLREAGLCTDPIFGAVPAIPPYDWMTQMNDVAMSNQLDLPASLTGRVDEAAAIVAGMFGHSNVYCLGWDEAPRRLLVAERKPWTYIHNKGLKVFSTATDAHLAYGGYNEDFVDVPGPVSRERSAAWHAMGARITSYAAPHTGPENPDFMRRVHGLQLYKANFDGIGNYILAAVKWNDFLGEANNFRLFNLTYPTREGVIDTLAWEGIREAVDDVRYATLLKAMAARAIATGKTEAVYAGRQALLWLERLDEKRADLDAARLELIDRILALRAYAGYPAVARKPAPQKAPPLRVPVAAPATNGPAGRAPAMALTTIEECRAFMAKPHFLARTYRLAVLQLIDLTAQQRPEAEARAVAEEAAADVKLGGPDRYLAKLVAAGLAPEAGVAALEAAARGAAAVVTNGPVTVEMKVAAFQDAGKLFMKMRRYDVARAFLALLDGLYRQEPKKNYVCRYLESAPATVEGWKASPYRLDPANKESRFDPYNRRAAELLVNDVNVERTVAVSGTVAAAETGFYMAWNESGLSLLVDCQEAEMDKVLAGLLGSGQLEMFLAPGPGKGYYQWFATFPKVEFKSVIWDSPNPHYRPMDPYVKLDMAPVEKGFAVSLFIPWELLYDKLPVNGDRWPFNIVRWSRGGGLTWSGKVHNLSAFGTVEWEGLTPERLQSIKRLLVLKGYGNYQKARGELAAFWKDEVLGDPVFYRERLQPMLARLDGWGAKVQPKMEPADIDFLFDQAVPQWMELPYHVAAARRAFLGEQLAP